MQPWVVMGNGTSPWLLFTSTWDVAHGASRVNIATADDGLAWTSRDASVPLPNGGSATLFGNRAVWLEPERGWLMLQEVGIPSPWAIYLYTSGDALTWTLASETPLSSLQRHPGGMYGGPSLANVDGKPAARGPDGAYHLWFHAASAEGNLPTDVYHATSADLLHWTVAPEHPVVQHSGSGFEYDQTADPSPVVRSGELAHIYWDGDNNILGQCGIGAATATPRAAATPRLHTDARAHQQTPLQATGSVGATCGDTTSQCPRAQDCCASPYSPSGWGCMVKVGSLSNKSAGCGDGLPPSPVCCKMGPAMPPSPTLRNVLLIGDSVSIGYASLAQPSAPELLSDVALAQHAPWDVSDGGAGDTANGVACLDRYLVTQAQQPVLWDLITFNFGLHDLTNGTTCEALYREQLTNITVRLQQQQQLAQLLYITTTPFMPMRLEGNDVVEDLNEIARAVMAAHGVPVLDLYAQVVAHCGPVPYADCDWCRTHPCSYHYNAAGMAAQAQLVAATVREMLNVGHGP